MSVPVLSVTIRSTAPERLLGVQPPDEDAALQESVGPEAEDDREQNRRLLRDRGDRCGDAGNDVLAQRVAAQEAHACRERDERDRDDEQDPHQPIQLPLERRSTALS